MKHHRIAMLGVALALAVSAAPSYAQSASIGQQASQCFVLYKIAAGLPGNAAHKGDLEKLGGLMSRTMQDNKVSQAQFQTWSDAMFKKIGTPEKPNQQAMAREVQACNGFAKQRYAHYSVRK